MKKGESILKPFGRVRGGVRLPHNKTTAEAESVVLTPPEKVIISMSQHIGAPCEPTVKVGDKVYVGTTIGDTDAFVSAPIHSSVSGEVSEITTIRMPAGNEVKAVVITSDGEMTPDPEIKPPKVETVEDLLLAARASGLVGLGGAGFPAHVKLKPSADKPLDTLIINGAECEPFITADYRECMEHPEDILGGVYLVKKLLGIERVIICVEDNKPKAIKTLYEIASDKQDADDKVKLMKLKSRYPQGAEKVLIYSATKRKLPLGKLPSDIGCIVMNITSISFLYRYIQTGMPLVSKRITVDGNAVKEPKNLIVPIGTPISYVLNQVKAENPEKVLMGGPMMGIAIYDTSLPVLKQNNAILAFTGKQAESKPMTDCIRCGRCMRTCPMGLTPAGVEFAVKNPKLDELNALNVMYCMECGSCAFVCPAGRPLTAVMRLAKNEVRKAGK
ncbi:MAG: electron transport complex subunit RsxC [Clostridia bacterium]|nr:electron transport complex subunit RsxC [Clostridia bacterium]